jgi:hypothetical protein
VDFRHFMEGGNLNRYGVERVELSLKVVVARRGLLGGAGIPGRVKPRSSRPRSDPSSGPSIG